MSNDGLKYYIQKTAEKIAEDKVFNSVLTGTIQESCAGYYKIKLNSSTIVNAKASLLNRDVELKKEDYVYLLTVSPSSGKDVEYYVFGLVGETNEEYANLNDWERFEALDGAKKTISNISDKGENITDSLIIEGINQNRTFIISAKFTCIYPEAIETDDYGLYIILNGKEDNPIKLTTDYFVGQPFNLTNSYQKRLITIEDINKVVDADTFIKSILIKRYVPDNFTSEVTIEDVTIEVGKLKDIDNKLSVSIGLAEGSKNYFLKDGNNTDSVAMAATARYDNQVLDTSYLQYFWFVENDTVKKDGDIGYSDLAGSGWYCLNPLKHTIIYSNEGQSDVVPTWEASSPTIIFDNKDLFKKYENKVKCIIRYQRIKKESKVFSVFNYNHYELKVTLKSKSSATNTENENILLTENEKITITCDVTRPNSRGITETKYIWLINGEELKDVNKNNIIIGDTLEENSGLDYNFKHMVSLIECKCRVELYDKEDILILSTESNSMKFYSYVSSETLEKVETKYYYLLSKTSSLSFTENSESTPTWQPVDGTWTLADTMDLESLKLLSLENGYMFYTAQKSWYTDDREGAIRQEPWTKPKILKKIDNGNNIFGAAIDQLNTFNELTQNGSVQGLEVADNGDVYLNATYIKSGTLRVGDENSPIFKASITPEKGEISPTVIIGGYLVDDIQLISRDGSVGMSSDQTEDAVAFWAGATEENNVVNKDKAPFRVTNDGNLYATKGEISAQIKITGAIEGVPSTIVTIASQVSGIEESILIEQADGSKSKLKLGPKLISFKKDADQSFQIGIGNDTYYYIGTSSSYANEGSAPLVAGGGTWFLASSLSEQIDSDSAERYYNQNSRDTRLLSTGLHSGSLYGTTHFIPSIYTFYFDRECQPTPAAGAARFLGGYLLLIGRHETWISTDIDKEDSERSFTKVTYNEIPIGGHGFNKIYGAMANQLMTDGVPNSPSTPPHPYFGGLTIGTRILSQNSSINNFEDDSGPYVLVGGDEQGHDSSVVDYAWFGLNIIIFGN